MNTFSSHAKRRAWYLGNTTVREAQRLRAGLSVLASSPLNGNLEGRERERDFGLLLNTSGVVRIARDLNADISDIGRKWRAALMQLGFIAPNSSRLATSGISDIMPFSVTENGKRLVESQSLPAQQETFLRALLALQLPSPVEPYPVDTPFNPLRVFLRVLVGLGAATGDSSLSKVEMAGAVEILSSESEAPQAIERILRLREMLKDARTKGDQPGTVVVPFLSDAQAVQKPETLIEYADSNFRYLRLTGLFKQERARLSVSIQRRAVIEAILSNEFIALDAKPYLMRFWAGSAIPTDDKAIALAQTESLAHTLRSAGVPVELPDDLEHKSAADVQRTRLDFEEQLLRLKEKQYASSQRSQWNNIVEYLEAFVAGGKRRVPKGEAPAYFEWIIWRAFLAIDSLVNEPWECRRFEVYEGPQPYEAFLPQSCAPGGGPDLLFEFEKFALVVEVTLTSSSRQEAAEGEPVRRHVAQHVDKFAATSKPVYGLFIAISIDTNTADTFRLARWYRTDDTEVYLKIVPLTLDQFTSLFKSAFSSVGALGPLTIEAVLRDCLAENNAPAPEWKRSIGKRIERFLTSGGRDRTGA